MGGLDIAAFVLATVGSIIAVVAGLVGARVEEGKGALEPSPDDHPGSDELVAGARETLGRVADAIARRRRAAQTVGGVLIVFGFAAFLLARIG